MRRIYILLIICFSLNLIGFSQNYSPITVSGFNQDLVIAIGESSPSTTTAFDRSDMVFFEHGFLSTSYKGLPANNQIISSANNNITYNLASYTGNNALFMNVQNQNYTLTLTNSATFSKISILATSSEGASTFSVVINYSDGTSSAATSFTVPDWVGGYSNVAISGLSRVTRAGILDQGSINKFKLFDNIVSVDPSKVVTSLTLTKTSSSGWTGIFAICGINPPPSPTATAATNIYSNWFQANWSSVSGANNYRLDVALDNSFNSILSSYNNRYVSGTSISITGLNAGTNYYYRVRAEDAYVESANSNTISVKTNNLPVANNLGPYSVGTGNSYNGNLSGSDPDEDSFTYVKYDGPTRGTLSYNSSTGSFTYTAPSDFVGSTSFRYRTYDGKEYSTSIATVSFTVSDDDNPIARTKNITVNLNSSGNATITASDVNNGSSDNIGITGLSVSPAVFNCANLGQNTVTLTVYDAAGNSDSETATVTVNDPYVPVANDDEYSIFYSETGNITYTLTVNSKEGVLANDTDVLACNGLTVNAVTNNPAHGTLNMNMANGSFTFKPTINYKGDDTFKYTATDGDNVSSEATVTIHIVTPTFTNGGGDGLFSNPANWNCGYVPDAESLDLIIKAAGLIIDQDYTCRNLQFLAGSSFSCNGGKLTITGNVLNRFGQVAIGISSSMVVSSSISINNE